MQDWPVHHMWGKGTYCCRTYHSLFVHIIHSPSVYLTQTLAIAGRKFPPAVSGAAHMSTSRAPSRTTASMSDEAAAQAPLAEAQLAAADQQHEVDGLSRWPDLPMADMEGSAPELSGNGSLADDTDFGAGGHLNFGPDEDADDYDAAPAYSTQDLPLADPVSFTEEHNQAQRAAVRTRPSTAVPM